MIATLLKHANDSVSGRSGVIQKQDVIRSFHSDRKIRQAALVPPAYVLLRHIMTAKFHSSGMLTPAARNQRQKPA